MRTITTHTNVYKFEELSEEGKKQAIEKWYDEHEDNTECELFSESATEFLTLLGFENPKVAWSLSYSQGDGFSFNADSMHDEKVIEFLRMCLNNEPKEKGFTTLENVVSRLNKEMVDMKLFINPAIIREYDFNIGFNRFTHHYAHAHTVEIEMDYSEGDKEANPEIVSYFEYVHDFMRDAFYIICSELEKMGYEQIYYRMDESEFQEMAECNQYEFTEDGALV